MCAEKTRHEAMIAIFSEQEIFCDDPEIEGGSVE